MKSLGKKPPKIINPIMQLGEKGDHYRQALLEIADEIHEMCSCYDANGCHCGFLELEKRIRISAGETKPCEGECTGSGGNACEKCTGNSRQVLMRDD